MNSTFSQCGDVASAWYTAAMNCWPSSGWCGGWSSFSAKPGSITVNGGRVPAAAASKKLGVAGCECFAPSSQRNGRSV